MRTTAPLALAATALFVFAGCTAPGGGTEPDPDPAPEADAPCIVGTWQLDVADYSSQAEAFVLGNGIPIVDWGLDGAGTITFTEDGLVATEIDLTTTGTIVAGETRVPLNQRSVYSGSGDWSPGSVADSIDIANWSNVPDEAFPIDPEAPAPAIDYTNIPTVSAPCTANDLVLQGPDAPISALWHR